MNAEEYIKLQKAIITHAKESWGGDYKKANKCFKTYTRRICELINAEGINIIYDLLKSDNLAIVSVAAYFLLPINSKVALEAYKKVLGAKHDGIASNAKITLNEWKKGRLSFPLLKDGKIIYTTKDVYKAKIFYPK
ncbi:hypothetical protein [Treponema pedis]|uniref:DUF2019 domain-containing protein n=1 Tax=Treponema pedis TaxID=409322 RepID=A0A7S7AX17_9SPIR|nr:hypothetical protein [Treponema pedis]QOW61910.1 hypothetical protein IFE08_06020 [Treponema pedis]QSI03474.1 hypothetical protein DYQ05_00350 [Treponema pedis]